MTKTEVVHIVSDLCSSGEPILKADINLAACLGRLITVAMPYQIIHAELWKLPTYDENS